MKVCSVVLTSVIQQIVSSVIVLHLKVVSSTVHLLYENPTFDAVSRVIGAVYSLGKLFDSGLGI